LLETTGDQVDVDVALLLVSELVTNAVRHAGGGDFEVRVTVDDGGLRVAVHDADTHPPSVRPRADFSSGGLGLRIVEGLAEAWGFSSEPTGGKTVWFRMPAG
jgi:anti-sigma regulatory factor (Ser/Thr protein kinase)